MIAAADILGVLTGLALASAGVGVWIVTARELRDSRKLTAPVALGRLGQSLEDARREADRARR